MRNTLATALALCLAALPCAAQDNEEWNFDDSTCPAKASLDTARNGKASGAPELVPGHLGRAAKLRGGVCAEPGERDYFEMPNPTHGTSPFTVECQVRTDKINHFMFVGDRGSARPYALKGWALGIGKDGYLVFVADNGTEGAKRPCASTRVLDTSWDPEGWNHLAGVRDTAKNTLSLYVNGELAAQVPDNAGDIASGSPLCVGKDTMSGVFFEGLIDELKLTNRALTPAEIKRDADFNLPIQPPPKEMRASSELVKLPTGFQVKTPEGATPVQQSAAAILKESLAALGAAMDGGAVIEIAGGDGKMRPEEYRLEGARSGSGYSIKIASNDHGAIYAADTLLSIVRECSLRNGLELSLPATFQIKDHPSVKNRAAVTGLERAIPEPDAHVDKLLRSLSMSRINIVVHGMNNAPEERLRALTATAAKYGIKVFAAIGYGSFSRGLSPLDAKDVQEWTDMVDKGGRCGCRGAFFLFDDLEGPEHAVVVSDPKCAAKFQKKIGLLQREMLRIGVAAGRKHGMEDFFFCPTPYMRGWQQSSATWWDGLGIDHKEYFKDVCDTPELEGLKTFHCDFLPEKIAELKANGLRNYAYFVNGIWPSQQWFTWCMGQTRLAWTWYAFLVDRNGKGPVAAPEAIEQLRHIDQLTDAVFLGVAGFEGPRLGGCWLWNPALFDEAAAGKALALQTLGDGAYVPLQNYEANVAPLVGFFRADLTPWTAECRTQVVERRSPVSEEELKLLWRNLLNAEAAESAMKRAFAAQTSPFQKPAPDMQAMYLERFDKTLKQIRLKLEAALKRKGVVVNAR